MQLPKSTIAFIVNVLDTSKETVGERIIDVWLVAQVIIAYLLVLDEDLSRTILDYYVDKTFRRNLTHPVPHIPRKTRELWQA